MNPQNLDAHDLIGLREDELDASEQAALDALLASDAEARQAHEDAQILGQTLAALPGVEGGPSAAEILARARKPAQEAEGPAPAKSPFRRWAPVVGAAVAAGALLWFGGTDPADQRARGVADADASVRLEAVAEGPAVHALNDGQTVQANESVVFHVTTTRPGALSLVEHGPEGSVTVHRWTAEPGRAALGGAAPLAWTVEDTTGGPRRYVVEWCEPGGTACVQDELSLAWQPR